MPAVDTGRLAAAGGPLCGSRDAWGHHPHLTPATVGVMMDLTSQAVKVAMERASGIERIRAGMVKGTLWGLRQGGGSETKVIPLHNALQLVVAELQQAM